MRACPHTRACGNGQANKKAREDLAATLARHAEERLDLEDERGVIKEILRYLGMSYPSSSPPARAPLCLASRQLPSASPHLRLLLCSVAKRTLNVLNVIKTCAANLCLWFPFVFGFQASCTTSRPPKSPSVLPPPSPRPLAHSKAHCVRMPSPALSPTDPVPRGLLCPGTQGQ